ncbi:hypothetical protein QZH41_012201 [Actinostola sp. cb2023]|nr:hypothetical protein QZH41_012201 [Actinostola sp. cb2023]
MAEVLEGTEGNLIQHIFNDLKSSAPVWDDFVGKAGKLHSALRATAVAADAFLDAFQRVADVANNSRGSSRDIGASLTKMVIRHRSIDGKLKALIGLLYDSLISPLQVSLDEWKRGVNQLDRDHAKEYKKCKQEMKKITAETLKWQKKVKKGKTEHQERLDAVIKQANTQLAAFEEQERKYLRKALIEERSRYCMVATCIKTVVEQEVSMLSEVEHLEPLLVDIVKQTYNPACLPVVGEDLVRNLRLSDHSSGSWDDEQTPPPSPTNSAVRTPAHPTALQLSSSPVHNCIRDPPTTPPPPPPSEKDAYFDAFSRHYSFSVKHSNQKGRGHRPKLVSATPHTSPKKQQKDMRASSFSISSNSSYSSMSSLGSSLGSPSTESLPHPPPPLPPQNISGSIDHLPPPPFPAVPSAVDQGNWKTWSNTRNDRSSWMTADSGCCSSSSGERSPSTSMAQVYCPSTVPEYPPGETTSSDPQYATPFVTSSRNRCMSESATSSMQSRVHRRSDSEASSQSSYYSGGSDATSIVSSDSGYFGQHHPHPEWQKENSAPVSLSPPKQKVMFNRSQSMSGKPNAAQAAQLAILASHAARSRSAPMPPVRKSSVPPPCPQRLASLLSEEGVDVAHEGGCPDRPSILLKQIQMQRQAIQNKSKQSTATEHS